MTVILALLGVWVLVNVLFVLIMVPPLKPRKRPDLSETALSPVPIKNGTDSLDDDEPFSLRHVVISVAMGAFFMLVPPLIAALHALERLARRSFSGTKGNPDQE
ncbi:hypothetical protein AC630_01835 [Bradyrhizobium sp. AS23.2]|nr:hypothetical protein AC630_01835 [Bradyrhizobium sp. AS23.2]